MLTEFLILYFQISCLKETLTSVIHKIWPSCTIHTSLLQASLDLLSVFTAHYPQG